jgi:hypothetical protein
MKVAEPYMLYDLLSAPGLSNDTEPMMLEEYSFPNEIRVHLTG